MKKFYRVPMILSKFQIGTRTANSWSRKPNRQVTQTVIFQMINCSVRISIFFESAIARNFVLTPRRFLAETAVGSKARFFWIRNYQNHRAADPDFTRLARRKTPKNHSRI